MALTQLSIHFSLELFSWNKAAGVVNHSPPSIAEFKNEWICTCAPPCMSACCGQGIPNS